MVPSVKEKIYIKTYLVLCGNFHSILGGYKYNEAIKSNDALHGYEYILADSSLQNVLLLKTARPTRASEFHQIQFFPAGLPSFCLMTFLCCNTAVILEKVFMTLQSEHGFIKRGRATLFMGCCKLEGNEVLQTPCRISRPHSFTLSKKNRDIPRRTVHLV